MAEADHSFAVDHEVSSELVRISLGQTRKPQFERGLRVVPQRAGGEQCSGRRPGEPVRPVHLAIDVGQKRPANAEVVRDGANEIHGFERNYQYVRLELL